MTSPVLGEAGGEDGTDLIMCTGRKGDSPVMLNLYLVGLSTDSIPKTLVTLRGGRRNLERGVSNINLMKGRGWQEVTLPRGLGLSPRIFLYHKEC